MNTISAQVLINRKKEKRCNGPCGQVKPLEEFHNDRRSRDGKQGKCKICSKLQWTKWKLDNPERALEWEENRRVTGKRRRVYLSRVLREKFGLSLDWYDRQMRIQKCKCASCGIKLDELHPSGKAGKLGETWSTLPCVHHSHQHGDVIDILCQMCNRAEGILVTPERAYKLWKYMSRDALFYSGKENGSKLDINTKQSKLETQCADSAKTS